MPVVSEGNKGKRAQARGGSVVEQVQGPAKSVVRHLDPDLYEGADGLSRFLEVLRASPLQQLPVPDVFSRLERWSQMKRHDREQISELLIREEELFTELQQALVRARKDREITSAKLDGCDREVPSTAHQPPSTPSRSPMHGRSFYQPANEEATETEEQPKPDVTAAQIPDGSDLEMNFEDTGCSRHVAWVIRNDRTSWCRLETALISRPFGEL